MPTNYPGSLDTLTNPSASGGDKLDTVPHDAQHADANDAIEAIQSTLGTDPQGSEATVRERIEAIEAAPGGGADEVARVAATSFGPLASGRWWRGDVGNTTTGGALSANFLNAIPMVLGFAQTWDRMAINVTVSASGNARLGIYASHPTTFLPNALVLDAGTVATDTTGVKEIAISESLSAGLYWMAIVTDVTPSLTQADVTWIRRRLGGSDFATHAVWMRRSFTYAALPDPWGGSPTYLISNHPLIQLRAA